MVSQGVAEFPDGEFHWQITTVPVTATSTPLDTTAPTFVIATGTGAVIVDGDGGPEARLAPGEAVFRRAGETSALHSLAPSGASALTIAAVAGPGDAAATFTPGASTRDIDLVRDVLNTNEALPLQADVAALVVVTAGSVDAGGVALAAGASTPVTGNVALINTSAEPATVFVALIGPTLGDVVLTEPTTLPTTTLAPAATGAPAAPGTSPAPTAPPAPNPPSTDGGTDSTPPSEPPTATEPAPAPDPTLDSDGDGLRDTDEAGFGSDPFDPDTDNDGLNDGADRGAGCSPTSYDTDGDGFSDGSEVNAGTNCAVAGTNG